MILYPNNRRWSVDLFGTRNRTVFSDTYWCIDALYKPVTAKMLNMLPRRGPVQEGYFRQIDPEIEEIASKYLWDIL
jgi:hypothetical protein